MSCKNFLFTEVAEGIDRILSAHQYSMLLCSSKWIEEEETRPVQSLIASRIDGVLLAKANIPFVVINCIPTDPSLSFVCCDNKMCRPLLQRKGAIALQAQMDEEVDQPVRHVDYILDCSLGSVKGAKIIEFLYQFFLDYETYEPSQDFCLNCHIHIGVPQCTLIRYQRKSRLPAQTGATSLNS